MSTNFPKLRPLIHKSYDYLLTKFHLQNEPGFAAEAHTLQKMVDEVTRVANAIYPGGVSHRFEYTVNNVHYILDRFIQVGEGKAHMSPEDVYVFADALDGRFTKLVTLLEEMDEQS